jgi:hypothetical protein
MENARMVPCEMDDKKAHFVVFSGDFDPQSCDWENLIAPGKA